MINLKFGDPVLIRSFIRNYPRVVESRMGYTPDDMAKYLRKWIRDYCASHFSITYKHIILTHGATGALDIIFHKLNPDKKIITHALHFDWYDKLAAKHGHDIALTKSFSSLLPDLHNKSVYLLDSPCNPWGNVTADHSLDSSAVLWDSVYASPVYLNSGVFPIPKHEIIIGSFSKMLGLSGLRLGWIGTNNDLLAASYSEIIETTYCGLSAASMSVLKYTLSVTDIGRFEQIAKNTLNTVREDFDKLRNIFSLNVPVNGMFYMGVLDKHNKKILERAGVIGLERHDKLTNNYYIRLNMCADLADMRAAVKSILKTDKTK